MYRTQVTWLIDFFFNFAYDFFFQNLKRWNQQALHKLTFILLFYGDFKHLKFQTNVGN